MKIYGVPFTNVDWAAVPAVEEGLARTKAVKTDGLQVRMVEMGPGHKVEHWCSRGHVVLVLEGVLVTELQDGRVFETAAGNSFHVGEDDGRHRARTEVGAKLFIVDSRSAGLL